MMDTGSASGEISGHSKVRRVSVGGVTALRRVAR